MIGIDEVGRGAWAGPLLVVAAKGVPPAGVCDSKLTSRTERVRLYKLVKESCATGEGWVWPEEIDALGLTGAMRIGVKRALQQLGAAYHDDILMDGLINYCDPAFQNVTCEARADAAHPIVSAASIYAKVRRDAYMTALDEQMPHFGFKSHVGYGTKVHKAALIQFGPTPHHRLSYKPVAKLA